MRFGCSVQFANPYCGLSRLTFVCFFESSCNTVLGSEFSPLSDAESGSESVKSLSTGLSSHSEQFDQVDTQPPFGVAENTKKFAGDRKMSSGSWQ